MTRHQARLIATATLLLALSSVVSVWAGPPTDQLRDGVDGVVRILRDPALAGEQRGDQRRAAIGRAASEIFDFGEMARRSLGPHWEKRTPAERMEFARLFTELIQRSYLARVDQHSAENVVVRTERVDGALAVVQTTLRLANGRELPLDYRMHNVDGRWQVYDLSMDGISIVANYRTQFDNVIRSASYEALVARMKSRQAEVSAPPAAPSPRKTGR